MCRAAVSVRLVVKANRRLAAEGCSGGKKPRVKGKAKSLSGSSKSTASSATVGEEGSERSSESTFINLRSLHGHWLAEAGRAATALANMRFPDWIQQDFTANKKRFHHQPKEHPGYFFEAKVGAKFKLLPFYLRSSSDSWSPATTAKFGRTSMRWYLCTASLALSLLERLRHLLESAIL